MRNLSGSLRRAVKLPMPVLVVVALGAAFVATAAFAANLSAGNSNVTIFGTTGNDNISAGNGDDHVWGFGGSDSINIGYGNDVIDAGGSGTLCPMPSKGQIVNVSPPNYQDNYCQHGPRPTCGSDNINAGAGNDVVYGNCGQNSINVGKGNNFIYGYGGPNTINVGNGNNTIYLYDTNGAGKGSNVSVGNGNNVVYAQNGVLDTINCGSKNTIVYADKTDRTSNCTVTLTPPHSGDVRGFAKHHAYRSHRQATRHRAHRTHKRSRKARAS
jgi:hypothetical protein